MRSDEDEALYIIEESLRIGLSTYHTLDLAGHEISIKAC